jgi:hypothetical protein
MELLGDMGQVETRPGPFGDSVNPGQNRCLVWDNCTIGSKIVLGTIDGTPR